LFYDGDEDDPFSYKSEVLIKFTLLKTHDSDNVSTSNETPYSAFGIH